MVVTPDDWRQWRRRFAAQMSCALRDGGRATLDVIFPHVCVLCFEPLPEDFSVNVRLCRSCQGELSPITDRACLRCGSPLAKMALDESACAACRGRKYLFDRATAYGCYQGKLRSAVVKAKLAVHEPLATALGELLAQACNERWPDEVFDAIVPMPMHWLRRWRRGTNSAELIAEATSRTLKIPLQKPLRMQRATAKQGTLTPRERFQNVRGAFRVRSGSHCLKDQRLLLIDDVMTTGATASEAARALRRAGAACVCVAVVARGVGK